MAKKTSFHLEPCDLINSESHNRRTRKFEHVRSDLSHLNQSHSYIDHSLLKEESNIKREVKEKTKRKMQKNAIAIKEGVILIKEDTTMEELQRFCAKCEERWGIVPLQIHTHMDEGHWKDGVWIPNLHAHIVFRMYNREGRNCRIKNVDCAEMQDLAAEFLGMERGKPSTKKHLSSLQFKIEQQEKTIAEQKEQIEQLQAAVKDKTELSEKLKGFYDGAVDLWVGKQKKRAEKAEEGEKRQKERAERAEKRVSLLEQDKVSFEQKARKEAFSEAQKIIDKERDAHKEDINTLESEWGERLRDTMESVKENFLNPQMTSQANELGLSMEQRFDLARGYILKANLGEQYGEQDIRWDSQKKSILAKAIFAMKRIGVHFSEWLKVDEWRAKFDEVLERNQRRKNAPSEDLKESRNRGRGL